MAKKKSKIRTLMKWMRRISFMAGLVGAVRKWQLDRNQPQQPPQA